MKQVLRSCLCHHFVSSVFTDIYTNLVHIKVSFALSATVLFCTHEFVSIVYIGVEFKAITPATATGDSNYCTCLGHLGRRDTDRIVSI